jgi:activator of HSP90 ATPase
MELNTTTITQKVTISAHPTKVFNAILNPKKHSEFTGSKATGKEVVGAKITAWDGYITGRNIEIEKNKRIVQEWSTTDWPDKYPPSILEFNFKLVDGKTELTIIHSNIPKDQEEELKQGWIDFYWNPLKNYFKK